MNKNQVSIIIPCYNKADTVARAIKSAHNQTYKDIEIIIVDDGSTDNSLDIIKATIKELKNHNVSYLRVSNGGVANARNSGILVSSGEFICTIDADDWIDPKFIEICVKPLINDNTLGITYTKLMAHLPDGKSQISQWPGEFNADKQFNYKARQNQIPTCCVFRREGFDRVGGYRKRYAPNGAGSEDAAFWTAILATGYTAKLVTNEALFNYSAFAGNVSGNEQYQEKDWLAWYPYTRTNKHPFASPVTPEKMAHIVRDYSEPVISIIVPVGEGHIQYLQDCIDSIEAQEFLQWELIIIDDTKTQALDTQWFMAAYPYAKIKKTGGQCGSGYARNLGASISKGQFLFFLDADDMLNVATPNALGEMLNLYNQNKAGVYSAYIGRSFIDDPSQLAPDLQSNILERDEKDGETWLYYNIADYDCETAQKQPRQDQAGSFYIWCNISTLMPRSWHNEIGGFDEMMTTWEDLDYWWRMARAGKCFVKTDSPFLIYRFYSGTRRELAHSTVDGVLIWENVINYLQDKYKELPKMGCNCGNKKIDKIVKLPDSLVKNSEDLTMNNNDFVMIEFAPTYTGGRALKSPTGKRLPNGKILEYNGYSRRAGDKFLVHVDDQAAKPDMFKLVSVEPEVITEPEAPQTIAPPEPIEIKPAKNEPKKLDLSELGLNAKQITALELSGIDTAEEIGALGVDGLARLSGFGKVSAKKLIDSL